MESRFGHDFSRVRIHADPPAAEASRLLDARAFTLGRHVAFAAGQYRPDTPDGRGLIAHELVHILQQQGAAPVIQRAGGGEPDLSDLPPLERPPERGPCLQGISGREIEAKGQQPGVISVVVISAAWCQPCKPMKSVLNELCHDYKDRSDPFAYRFYEVDYDETPQLRAVLAEKYASGGLPTTLMLADGRLLRTITGLEPRAAVESALAEAAGQAAKGRKRKEPEEPREPAPQEPTPQIQRQTMGGLPATAAGPLQVSRPGDQDEQQADRIAAAVLDASAASGPARRPVEVPPSGFGGIRIQRRKRPDPDDKPVAASGVPPPISVDSITIVDSESGAVGGFPDIKGPASLDHPGPFDNAPSVTPAEIKNVHQIHVHFDQGEESLVMPYRTRQVISEIRGGNPTREGKRQLEGPGEAAGVKDISEDDPGIMRLPPDRLVVADAPGPYLMRPRRDYPYDLKLEFLLRVEEKDPAGGYMLLVRDDFDPCVAWIRYLVEIHKEAADIPADPNRVSKLEAMDRVRQQPL
jgi:hypothetical protein